MDTNLLIEEYLRLNPSQDANRNWNTALVEAGNSSGWRVSDVEMPTMQQLQALNASMQQVRAQKQTNKEAREFLASTDWKVLRHQDQILAGDAPSLSEQELQTLLAQRKAARDSIVE